MQDEDNYVMAARVRFSGVIAPATPAAEEENASEDVDDETPADGAAPQADPSPSTESDIDVIVVADLDFISETVFLRSANRLLAG